MVNILLERYMIDDAWLYDELKEYIKPHHNVLVVAFSFRDKRVKNADDWDVYYGKPCGMYYRGIVDSFKSYGLKEENIKFLNYFTDTKQSAKEKVEKADILYFLGGLPDRMYERLAEFELVEDLKKHEGTAIGYSAGAVIQLEEYHLSPDDDYPVFSYNKGIPYLNGFYIEVHYKNTDTQNASVRKVLAEKKKTVYATRETGAIVVDNGKIKLIGDVEIFTP
ncbi:MAG: Type 1 glutamine amidotransferase-like domain-containing protein [Clostridia bacterium]|nr:Type 1 glutamine amidotransferase-like domain-containing protein [Clostridia bacterium]